MRIGLLCETAERIREFEQAVKRHGGKCRTLLYSDVLKTPALFGGFIDGLDIFKADSPGGGYETWSLLANRAGFDTALYQDKFGQIYPEKPAVTGLHKILKELTEIALSKSVYCTANPGSVLTCTDKTAAAALLRKNSISVPRRFEIPNTAADLVAQMHAQNRRSFVIKPRFGSAASGVSIVDLRGSRIRIYSTVEIGPDGILYNSLKIRRYLDEDALELIEILLTRDIVIEARIQKLAVMDLITDFRIVVADGKPAHILGRASKNPITNLHLGNQRLSYETLKTHLSPKLLSELSETARRVGALFPEHFCLGVDIMADKDENLYVPDVNCFGDHLNNVLYDGLGPYAYQLKILETKLAERQ